MATSRSGYSRSARSAAAKKSFINRIPGIGILRFLGKLLGKVLPKNKRARQATIVALSFAAVGTIALIIVHAFAITGPWGSVEQDQAQRVNTVRSQNGLGGIRHAECLHQVAQEWTRTMASTGNFAHNPSLGASVNARCGGGWTELAENVGWGYDSPSIFNAFIASSGHYKNITGQYTVAGFGAYKSDDGRLWVTQVYAQCPCGGTWSTDASIARDPGTAAPQPPAGVTIPVRKFDNIVGARTAVTVQAGNPGKTIIGNLTAVSQGSNGYATVLPYACPAGLGEQGISHINFTVNQSIANQVVTGSDGNGQICIYTAGTARIIWDTQSETTTFAAHMPQRIFDSRYNLARKFNPNEVIAINVRDPNGNSVAGKTVHGNLTATEPESQAWLAVFPCTEGWNGTSNVQFNTGQTIAIHVVVKADQNSQICVLSPVRSHVIWDQMAEHTAYTTHNPVRKLDTRNGGRPGSGGFITINTGAGAFKTVVGTLTAVNASEGGFATILPYGCNGYFDNSYSNLNYTPGQNVANNVITQTDGNGDICLYTARSADYIWDQVSESNVFATQSARTTSKLVPNTGTITNTPPASSGTWTSVNDNTIGTGLGQFQYTGGWCTVATTGAYKNDEHCSNASTASYQMKFKGTQVKVYSMKNPNYGKAAYSVDGGPETIVDHYASSRQFNFLAYTSSALSAGEHTVKVRVLNQKSTAASGTYIAADRIDYLPVTTASLAPAPAPSPAPTTTFSQVYINNTDVGTGENQYNFAGTWNKTTTTGAYNNDETYSNATNNYYTIKFTGTQITVYSMYNPNYGIVGFSVDGGAETTYNFYNATRIFKDFPMKTPVLPRGTHTVKVRITGNKDTRSSGTFHAADYAIVTK